jgi:Heterokaryon incompatibility protein (HET)
MPPKESALSISTSESVPAHIVAIFRRLIRRRFGHNRPSDDSILLCEECLRIGWSHLFLYASDGNQYNQSLLKGTVQDLIRRQPCAFCRLILHLASAKDAQIVVAGSIATLDMEFLQQPYEVVQNYSLLDRFMVLHIYCGKSWGSRSLALKGTIDRVRPSLNLLRRAPVSNQLGTPLVNSKTVLSWIENCTARHELCRKHGRDAASRQFAIVRLIDVVEKRLVKAQEGCKYVALSYVWGMTSMFRTQTRDLTALEEKGGLSPYWNQLGRTIQDAIIFVASLNERYLWVDAVCILQDDAIEMRTQISQMDTIYSQASLTLIALSAKDASSDLPGVRPGSRSTTRAVEAVQGHVLTAQPSCAWNEIISSSVYDTRAWTFQESILSPRCLYFAEKRVIFQCLQDVEIEHPLREEEEKKPNPGDINPLVELFASFGQGDGQFSKSVAPTTDFMRYFYFYQVLTSIYTNRNLTYPSDFLNAFSGVLATLERRGAGPFVYGLPEANLDLALLWNSGNAEGTARRNLDMNSPQHENYLPSWTWVGWTGSVRWDLYPSRATNFTDVTDGTPYIRSAITHLKIQEQNHIRPILRARSSTSASNIRAWTSNQICRPSSHPAPLPSGVLRFRAYAAPLSRFSLLTEEAKSGGPFRFITFNDRVCGLLHCPEPFQLPQSKNPNFEIILLSHIRDKFSNLYIVTQTSISNQFMAGFTWQEWSVANIMLIGYSRGLAERIAVGQIHIDALERAKLKRKWISLA